MKIQVSRVLRPDELAAIIRERPGVGEHAGEIGASVAEPVVLVRQSGQCAGMAEEAGGEAFVNLLGPPK